MAGTWYKWPALGTNGWHLVQMAGTWYKWLALGTNGWHLVSDNALMMLNRKLFLFRINIEFAVCHLTLKP
jgi:hypothetical protein